MQRRVLKYDFLLLLAAFIWGTNFVAQRKGMDYIGPLLYNGLRFAIGSIVLVPVLVYCRRTRGTPSPPPAGKPYLLLGSVLAGVLLFAAATMQQMGLVHTTAGKAGFITALYVVIIPVIGLAIGHHIQAGEWTGALLAIAGMYLLSVKEGLTIERGDILVLTSAFFWALHVICIGHLAQQALALTIACLQFTVCSLLSFSAALFTETIAWQAILDAAIPILYGGLFSAGIAFSLQIVCQRSCPPTHAAIIMSFETVFAALGGWLILGEILSRRDIVGCLLMLIGILVVQLAPRVPWRPRQESTP